MQRPADYTVDAIPVNGSPAPLQTQGGAMMPYQPPAQQLYVQQMPVQQMHYNANHPRQSVPVFTVNPSDFLSGMIAIRAYLSCVKHRPVMTIGWSLFSFWVFGFALAAGANTLRPDTKTADCVFAGCLANPISAGTNIAALLKGVAIAPAATHIGDTLLDQNTSINRNPIRQEKPQVSEAQ